MNNILPTQFLEPENFDNRDVPRSNFVDALIVSPVFLLLPLLLCTSFAAVVQQHEPLHAGREQLCLRQRRPLSQDRGETRSRLLYWKVRIFDSTKIKDREVTCLIHGNYHIQARASKF